MAAPKFTFSDFIKQFPNDDVALDYIFKKRFGDLEFCPECAAQTKWHRIKTRKVYSCSQCSHQISPTAGTIFHGSRTPLTSWIFVVLLFANSRNGVSAKEIQRQIGVTYKTAWRMGHLIRTLMDEGQDIFMSGTVELDEALFNGRHEWAKPNTNPPKRDRHPKKKRGWGADKQCVFGLLHRKDEESPAQVHTMPVPDRRASTLLPIIVEHVSEDATVFTDEYKGYNKLGREVEQHETVCHSDYEWTRGNIHTQGIEAHWSVRKRCIRGTYTSISRKYMHAYLNEYDFRYNHKEECVFSVLMDKI